MNDGRLKILNMLAAGKITAAEAERLLDALDGGPSSLARPTSSGSGPRYLRVQIEKERGDEREPKQVNVRVPLSLLRAGVRLQSLLPAKARGSLGAALAENGVDIDLDRLKGGQLDALIEGLTRNAIDIDADDGRARVRVSCE